MSLRKLSVDRVALLEALTLREGGLVCTYLDLQDGTLLALVDPSASAAGSRNEALEARLDEDPDRYARVPLFEREYRLMLSFVDTVEDDGLAIRLDTALSGRGAFRGFAEILVGVPGEQQRWESYRADALARFAVTWLRTLALLPAWAEVPEPDQAEVPWVLQVALRGQPGDTDEALIRTLTLSSEADARRTFNRLARELCEIARTPYRARITAKSDRFTHGGVDLRIVGTKVIITVPR